MSTAMATSGMSLRVDAGVLREAVETVAHIIPKETTLPILRCVLVDTNDGLTLSTSDLDQWLRLDVTDADVQTAGACAVPVRRFAKLLQELDGPLSLRCGKNGLTVDGCGITATLHAFSADEFPRMPVASVTPLGSGIVISADVLVRLLASILPVISTDLSRPILNGAYLHMVDGRLTLAATNGHRLRIDSIPVDADSAIDVTLRREALKLIGVFTGGDIVIRHVNDSYVAIEGDDAVLYTRTIEGPFPNYRKVIPTHHDVAIRLDRAAFDAVIRRVAVIASEETGRLHFSFGETSTVDVSTPDVGTARATLPVLSYEGPPLRIGFNAKYMLSMLAAAEGKVVELRMTDAEHAMWLIDASDAVSLVMPLRLLD